MKTTQRLLSLIPVVLLATAACSVGAQIKSATRQPNVIIVLPDQWRAQALGYAGDPNVKTPNLDRLANESINFTHAVAGMPVCCPTRASLMTGQRPLTTGVFLNDVPLSPQSLTLATSLAATGYDTGYIGKWHLNGGSRTGFVTRDRRLGFEYWKACECTHDYNRSVYHADSPAKLLWQGYDAIAQTEDAAQYIRSHEHADKPFFLVLSWGPPHSPYESAPQKYRAMYPADNIVLRANVPKAQQAKTRAMLANYYAHCTALDDCLGTLRDTLKATGLDENTLLIFSSDHGDLLGSQGGRDKQQPYDESIRVPLLMHWPAALGKAPRQLDTLVSSEDIMPTILGLCGVAIPGTVEGRDFSDYMRGGKDPSDGAAVISCASPFGQWTRKTGGREYRGVRTVRYTYVRDLSGPWLLFDNDKDPFQETNLVNSVAHAKIRGELDALLNRKLAENNDRFLPGAAYIQKWGYAVDREGTVAIRE